MSAHKNLYSVSELHSTAWCTFHSYSQYPCMGLFGYQDFLTLTLLTFWTR